MSTNRIARKSFTSIFEKAKDGEWIRPKRKGYVLECCDCGAIHTLDFRLVKYGNGKSIEFRAFRIEER